MTKIKLLKPDEEHLRVLRQGVDTWNRWRKDHPDIRPNLSGAFLSDADLSGANLSGAVLSSADLREANLSGADLRGAYLRGAYLREANLSGADLREANLSSTFLSDADLRGAILIGVILIGAILAIDLTEADKEELKARGAIFKDSSEKATTSHYNDALNLTLEVSEDSPVDEVAAELATLCKALSAYHIALGGNGLEIDDWETLVAVRSMVGV